MTRLSENTWSRAGVINSQSGGTAWYTLGAAASAGERDDELFLERFGGEVLTTFTDTNVMMGLHEVRTIDSGKQANFPVLGTSKAAYHAPGSDILLDSNGDTISNQDDSTHVSVRCGLPVLVGGVVGGAEIAETILSR